MTDHGKPPPDMKLFPRNLTARADYVVRGNPVISRPESGADNCHPGLEFDQRNLDRYFFPGLRFDFQFGAGARLTEIRSQWLEKTETGGGRCFDIDLKKDQFFLWYVFGSFGDLPDQRQVISLYGLDGYEVLRKVHDLEPEPVIIAVGRRPVDLNVSNTAEWLRSAGRLKKRLEDLQNGKSGELGAAIETFRDPGGVLQFALLAGRRAAYLDEHGVIEPPIFEAGVLTQSLCSPWQWDFADCGCFYWAASRPDIVSDASGAKKGLNFLRADRNMSPPEKPVTSWKAWTEGTMLGPQLISRWETLPVVIGEREADVHERGPAVAWPRWNLSKIIEWLRYLAEVEHALCVKFLYAHYSLNVPPTAPHAPVLAADLPLTKVAKEIFEVAIDEMRHFRWVNEALCMLGEKAAFGRATELRRLVAATGELGTPIPLTLEPLTREAIKQFIQIEQPSQVYGTKEQIAGLYTHILVSLQGPEAAHELPDGDKRERLQEICKLIIDEGGDHYHRAERVRAELAEQDPDQYLRVKGPPAPAPEGSDDRTLQELGDQYYQLMLAVLRQAFDQTPEEFKKNPEVRGRTIRQARRVMYNLHEVGHLLGARGKGLLFTMPLEPTSGTSAYGGTLTTSIPRLLAPLRTLGSKELADMAARHAQTMAEGQGGNDEDEGS